MILSAEQNDALAALINTAFSRTASTLSDLTGRRVLLDVSEVTLTPVSGLSVQLSHFVKGEVAAVHQIFSDTISGDALLLLNIVDAACWWICLLTATDRQAGWMPWPGRF